MNRLQPQIAAVLLAHGISGSVSADCRTVYVDDPAQLEAAAKCLATYFPECTAIHHPEEPHA